MQEMVGREVRVNTGDIEYRGLLVEIGEADVHLESEAGWIVIPLENIVDIQVV